MDNNTDNQLIMLSLFTIIQIFEDELPAGKDPARATAIKEMAGALKLRVTQLQEEAKIMEEAQHETAH